MMANATAFDCCKVLLRRPTAPRFFRMAFQSQFQFENSTRISIALSLGIHLKFSLGFRHFRVKQDGLNSPGVECEAASTPLATSPAPSHSPKPAGMATGSA
jgi:hypothetical protein